MNLEPKTTKLKSAILSPETFIRAEFKGKRKGLSPRWEKVTIRPVELKGVYHLQISYFDGRHDVSKNYRGDELSARVNELLAEPFSSIVIHTTTQKLRAQITKKGKIILHREKYPAPKPLPNLTHDRPKGLIFPFGEPNPFLYAVGITTADGKIKAKMTDKFWQINRFLDLVSQTLTAAPLPDRPLTVIDCGCGNAYLTFATYYFLTEILGQETRLIGIDVNADLMAKRNAQVAEMGWRGLEFHPSSIIDFRPDTPPDIVLALHACDTATDEALAQAIRWESRFIFSVPCCHHHLQAQLPPLGEVENLAYKSIFRHGILKERLGDILTDTFRALILRILGYRTDVVEFISSEHTARNLMIRAEKTTGGDIAPFIAEYRALKSFWGVTPYLETLLKSTLTGTVETQL